MYIPFVGSINKRGLDTDDLGTTPDQIFINCIVKKFNNPLTGATTIKLEKRFGFDISSDSVSIDLPTDFSIVDGFFPTLGMNSDIPVIIGSAVTTGNAQVRFFYNGTSTLLKTHADASYFVNGMIELVSSGGTQAIAYTRGVGLGSTHDGWLYTKGGAVSSISIPSGATGTFAYLNGWTFICADNKIYNSALNDPTTGYSDFIGADLVNDTLVNIIQHKGKLYAYGTASCQVYDLVENTVGSPLRLLPDLTFHVGLRVSNYSNYYKLKNYTQAEDTIFWIGTARGSSAPGIYKLNNGSPQKISTPEVDRYISTTFDGLSYIKYGGKRLLTVSGESNQILVYDIEYDWWSIWNSTEAHLGNMCYSGENFVFTVNDDLDLLLADQATPVYQDNAISITREIQTSKLTLDSAAYKRHDRLSLVADTQPTTSNIAVSWSDDDYTTFSTPINIDLSKSFKSISGLGTARDRSYKFTDTLNSSAGIYGIDLIINQNLT